MLLVIGLGHICVVKGEYYFGTRLWSIFLIIALSSIIASIFYRKRTYIGHYLYCRFHIPNGVFRNSSNKKSVLGKDGSPRILRDGHDVQCHYA